MLALVCIVSAFCAWVAIDAILLSMPLLGGLNLIMAFANCGTFCRAMEWIATARQGIADLRALKLPE